MTFDKPTIIIGLAVLANLFLTFFLMIQFKSSKKTEDFKNELDEVKKLLEDDSSYTALKDYVSKTLQTIIEKVTTLDTLKAPIEKLGTAFSGSSKTGKSGEKLCLSVLKNFLAEGMYIENFPIPDSTSTVEFVVIIKQKDGSDLYLPIDAKTPRDRFVSYIEERDLNKANTTTRTTEKTKLITALKKEAKRISDSYINKKTTCHLGIMYLPFEGWVDIATYELEDTVDEIKKTYNVFISGPHTLAIIISIIKEGYSLFYRTQKETEVVRVLLDFKKDAQKIEGLLSTASGHFTKGQNNIVEAQQELAQVVLTLNNIESNISYNQENKVNDDNSKD